MSVTTFRLSSKNALMIDDLPAFGRPTTAILGISSSITSFISFVKLATTASKRSPVPEPVSELMQYGSPRPRL